VRTGGAGPPSRDRARVGPPGVGAVDDEPECLAASAAAPCRRTRSAYTRRGPVVERSSSARVIRHLGAEGTLRPRVLSTRQQSASSETDIRDVEPLDLDGGQSVADE
jgi:hypothetical protein